MSYGNRDVEPLFWTNDGSSAVHGTVLAACSEVDKLSQERILNTDPEALTDYFVKKFAVDVPTLDRDALVGTHHERNIQAYDPWDQTPRSVRGEAYDFELPFSGEADIFKLRPNQYDTAPPHAQVRGQALHFTIADRTLAPEKVKAEVDQLIASIERYLGWHRQLWAEQPRTLAREVRQRIDERRGRLLTQKNSAAALVGLGIKLKEKPGDPKTYVPPKLKQIVQPQLPPMKPSEPPEPTLDQQQYETILGLLRDAGRSIEQSSSRMRDLGEEALRDIFLVPLNAHFGTATGEAFNFKGKTDVLIREQGGNLFVAEFKIWGGEKHFLETIDQLLSYLTWRDTKTAIVVFNRNAGFSSVVAKMRAAALTHPSYVSGPTRLDETSDRYRFTLPIDRERQVSIAILAFDLGVAV